MPEDVLAELAEEDVKVEKLVQEFLAAQSLKILPQAPFGDAVSQFVNKDDKHAMETFVKDSLADQVRQMLNLDPDDDDLDSAIEQYRKKMEDQFGAGIRKQAVMKRVRPKPDDWDSDLEGHWEDQPGVIEYQPPPAAAAAGAAAPSQRGGARGTRGPFADSDEDDVMADAPVAPPSRRGVQDDNMDEDDDDEPVVPARRAPAATRRGAAAASTTTASRATKAAPAKKAAPPKKPPARAARGKKAVVEEDEDEEEADDFIEDDEFEPQPPPPPPKPAAARRGAAAAKKAAAPAPPPAPSQRTQSTRAAATRSARQTKLTFSSQAAAPSQKAVELSDDEISDDVFESMPSTRSRRK